MACSKNLILKIPGRLVATTWLCRVLVAVAVSGIVQAQDPAGTPADNKDRQYQAGVHFKVLKISVEPAQTDKIEVVEVFSYACIHCFNFDPYIEDWITRLPDNVVFTRVPVAFGNHTWRVFAQTYYSAKALGVLDKTHTPFFRAIHERREKFLNAEQVADFFTEFGVAKKDFLDAYESFDVHSEMAKAKAKALAYKITGVPTLVVAGKYRISSTRHLSNQEMLEVADFLIERERIALLRGVETTFE